MEAAALHILLHVFILLGYSPCDDKSSSPVLFKSICETMTKFDRRVVLAPSALILTWNIFSQCVGQAEINAKTWAVVLNEHIRPG